MSVRVPSFTGSFIGDNSGLAGLDSVTMVWLGSKFSLWPVIFYRP